MSEHDIVKRLQAIEQRNIKVELDKAWEVSWTRRILIMALTYLVIAMYLTVVIRTERPLLDALVPVTGYLLSTLVLRFVRKCWEKQR